MLSFGLFSSIYIVVLNTGSEYDCPATKKAYFSRSNEFSISNTYCLQCKFVLCAQSCKVSLERLLHHVEQFIFSGRFGYIIK